MTPIKWYYLDLQRFLYRSIDKLKWKIAYLIPREIALLVFVRVYSITGECDSTYPLIYDMWKSGKGK